MSGFSYGQITNKMMSTLKPIVTGRTVWALGSGRDDKEARMLLALGARGVTSIDKLKEDPMGRRIYFADFEKLLLTGSVDIADVAFIKWPITTLLGADGLARLAARCNKIVYIGKNDGFTACGDPSLWYLLRRRKLETVVEHEANDMLIYGEYCDPRNPETREEAMAFASETGDM